MKLTIELSDERKRKVYDELLLGSAPQGSFFLLVAVSTLIAAFGLVMNSTAVVIGAMLVAPLMTPILGLGLGLVRGDTHLIGLALRAEVLGVAVSLFAGATMGLILPTGFEPTSEMLSRTTPNLLDLLVAVLAGLAGAYALVDEKISPVLPGVAISVAIVPPLANSGISLAMGAYEGAAGSFLLFFANFLSILLVSALIFYLAGMAEVFQSLSGSTLARRFGVAFVGFVIVALLLGNELAKMFENRRIRAQITHVLEEDFSDRRVSGLGSLKFEKKGDALIVLADVDAPTVVSPRTVNEIQRKVEEVVEQPIELFIRTTVTHDVSAVGSINQAVTETLDGYVTPETENPLVKILRTAEQVIREYFDEKRGIRLKDLRAIPFEDEIALVAEVSGLRRVAADEIQDLEDLIQDRLVDTKVGFVVQQNTSDLVDRSGGLRLEFYLPKTIHEEEKLIADMGQFARNWMSEKSFWLHSWSFTILDDVLHFLFEVKGPNLFTDENLAILKQDMSKHFNREIEIYVRSEIEAVVGPNDYESFTQLLDEFRQRNRDEYGVQIRESVIKAR